MDWLKGQRSAQALVTFRPNTAGNRDLAVNGFMITWHFVLDADSSNTAAPGSRVTNPSTKRRGQIQIAGRYFTGAGLITRPAALSISMGRKYLQIAKRCAPTTRCGEIFQLGITLMTS